MTTDLVGKRLCDFEIVRELGRGGMGVVYEAVQTTLNRRVALKVLGPGLGLTPRAIERFQREAEAAAKLHHTNIVPVYATGEEAGIHFYAMELIDGPSLDSVIRQMRQGEATETRTELSPNLAATGDYVPANPTPLPTITSSPAASSADRFDRAAAMIADVADALHHAHSHGVTHRDVKPSNLLLSSDGRLSITDFGLARMLEQPGMTVTGEFVGTPAYMSPEQITAGRIPVDHRTDVHSLGATLYELLTLRPPFVAEGRDRLLAMVVQKEPASLRSIDPKVPRDLETICLKCLEKDPDRRYQSAKELADDLRRYVNCFAILAKRAGPIAKLKKWVKRNPVLTAAGLVVLLSVGTAGEFAWKAHESDRLRAEEKWKQEEEAIAQSRQAAMELAIVSAMASEFTRADTALLEAERLGADLAERRFVAGIVSHHRGNSDEARRLLLEACNERPEWVAPRAFLSMVCNYVEDYDGSIAHGNKALELTPITAEDYLFRGYVVGSSNPQRGMRDVDRAWNLRRSVLAQLIRAEVLWNLADDTGRVEDAEIARDAIRAVRAFLGDAPLVTVIGLSIQCVGCNNARLHRRPEKESQRWLDEGAADFRAAASTCRTHPLSLWVRGQYLHLRDGFAETPDQLALIEETREAGKRGSDSSACEMHVAFLFRHGNADAALAYLQGIPSNRNHCHTLHKALFMVESDKNLQLARDEFRQIIRRGPQWHNSEYLVWALSLVGLPEEARITVIERREALSLMPSWTNQREYWRRAFGHAYANEPMDLEADAGGSRWSLHLGYNTMGFAALGRGDRATAREWFRKADDHPPVCFSDYVWHRAIHARLLTDPNWPPWLARKK